MPTKPTRVIIDPNANWQFNNPSALPTPRAQWYLNGSGGDRDAFQIRDQLNNVLWWIDGFGVPHFPNNSSGALPTPSAAEVRGIPGVNPSNLTVVILEDASKNPLGWININPNGYGGTLASLAP
jgi:hypothetical protein